LGGEIAALTPPTAEGKLAARSLAIDLLATLYHELQDLEELKRIVKMLGLVNIRAEFYRAAFGRERRVRASPGSIGRQG